METIDKFLKETNTVLIPHEGYVEMKNILSKYQRIIEIYNIWGADFGEDSLKAMRRIGEVIKG